MSLNATQQQFFDQAITEAKLVFQETGLLISGQVAQACLESAWGSKKPQNNCFGIKAHNCAFVSAVQQFTTHENMPTGSQKLVCKFAGYKTLTDCFRCHALILRKNFPSAYTAKTPEDYAKFLFFDPVTKLKYATDPHYQTSLLTVVKSHNLTQYDILKVNGTV
jgi:flagellum-specific peptidoglycan hydrolase FlgJ